MDPAVSSQRFPPGYLPVSFLVEHRHLESQAKDLICRCPEVPVYTAEFDVLTQLTGFQLTRGMLCAMHRRPLPSVKEICAGAKRIAVLENVVNPTNVGAIFRSAAALHVDAVLLTEACSNPLYRRSIRVSMGTVFQVPWTYLTGETAWPHPGIDVLREMGYRTIPDLRRRNGWRSFSERRGMVWRTLRSQKATIPSASLWHMVWIR